MAVTGDDPREGSRKDPGEGPSEGCGEDQGEIRRMAGDPGAAGTRIRPAQPTDAAAIAAIHNLGIAERSSTFETAPRQAEEIAARLASADRLPILVAVDDADRVLGFAGISSYRPRACYAGIGEFSIYLDAAARSRGIGTQLLDALVREAGALGYWKLLSRVFTSNHASRRLMARCGFREVGLYEKHALLDGQWRDVVIVERLIAEGQALAEAAARAAAPTGRQG